MIDRNTLWRSFLGLLPADSLFRVRVYAFAYVCVRDEGYALRMSEPHLRGSEQFQRRTDR